MKLGQWLFWRTDERRVLIMGLDNAGKTTLLYRWLLDEVITTIPTIGFNVETVKYPKGFAFTMWDVGGCDKIRPLYRHYFQNTQFVLFVHDCADKERFNEQLDLLKMSMLEDELRNAPTLIVLNKQDLLSPEEREAEVARAKQEYEKLAASCGRRAPIKILSECPGFSATGMENPKIVLEEMAKILTETDGGTTAKKKAVVQPQTPGVDPSEAERAKAQAMVDADNMAAKDFWRAFEDGSLTPWDHYHHLKSGFFVLVEAFENGQGVLDAAETFIDHLERLRRGNPERFRNTTHRTMTIFWLAQLHVAAANYIQGLGSARVLQRADFKDILVQSPELTNARLWENYYSKGLLFTPEAKEHWRLPDVKAMPSVTTAPSHQPTKRMGASPPSAVVDSDRLIRFGLTVIQTLMASKSRRGVVVKTALAALQTWTMRERAVNTVIPPYSETQAYFWIQFVHAALATESAASQSEGILLPRSSSLNWNGSVDSLTLPAFKTLYGVVGNEWQAHYSAKVWESVSARMQFCPPDKKPLPNVIQISGQSDLDAARSAMIEQYAASEKTTPLSALPTANDLAIVAAVLVNGVEEGTASDHGAMLQVFFDLLYASQDRKRDADTHRKSQSLAIMKALEIPCAGVDGLTQRMFWVQQVLVALSTFQGDGFGEFVRSNAHLAYQHLPYVYYSPMLWASQEAEEVYIGPDLKPLVSRVE